MDIVVAITGASGAVYGVRLLEVLNERGVQTHLLVSKVGLLVLKEEMGLGLDDVRSMATYFYDSDDLTARICSGSYKTDGMAIVPCSMKTLAAIANGFSTNTITRVADVMIKEKNPLIVVPRETPLSSIHLRNLASLAQDGVRILPAMPAFYQKPRNISDLVDFIVGRILETLDIEHDLYKRYSGLESKCSD